MGKAKSAPPRSPKSPRAKTGAAPVKQSFRQTMTDDEASDLLYHFLGIRMGASGATFEALHPAAAANRLFPDLVIRHDETIYLLEFFDKDDGLIALNTAVLHASVAEAIAKMTPERTRSLAVWVGEALVGPVATSNVGETSARCPIVDIREPFENDGRIDAGFRHILGRLKQVHEAHGGLFQRLLKLPPEEHQREFVRIASSLGFRAAALRI
jgi:hypothetical protein